MSSSAFIRKNFRRTALASVVALGAFGASNSFAADATATATGTVIEPIAITKVVDLNFGQFAPGSAGGTVTVATNGDRTASGPILSSTGASAAAAQFDVTGAADATYSIAWSGDTELTDGATNTMTLGRISELTPSASTTVGDVTSGTLASGAQSIYLGGELTVATAQAAGTYTGNVTVTVEYN